MGLLRGHSRRKECGTDHSRVSARLSKLRANGSCVRSDWSNWSVQWIECHPMHAHGAFMHDLLIRAPVFGAYRRYVDQSRSARAGTW
jgi:hypothetical protein